MKLVSAPPTFISATLQPQAEDFQNENRTFGSGCECAILCLKNSNHQSLNQPTGVRLKVEQNQLVGVYWWFGSRVIELQGA